MVLHKYQVKQHFRHYFQTKDFGRRLIHGDRGGTIQEWYCDFPKKVCDGDGHSRRNRIDGCLILLWILTPNFCQARESQFHIQKGIENWLEN